MLRTTIAIAAICGITTSASAVSLLQYNFDDETAALGSVAGFITATDFKLNDLSGLVTPKFYNQGTGKAIADSGWNVDNGAKWWSFSLTADAGMELTLDSLVFKDRATGTGADEWSMFINDITVATGSSSKVSSGSLGDQFVDLSPYAASLSGIMSAEFKLFGFGASSPGGTWRLDDVVVSGGVMLKPILEPDATSVPESFGSTATLAVLIPVVLGMFRFRGRPLECP